MDRYQPVTDIHRDASDDWWLHAKPRYLGPKHHLFCEKDSTGTHFYTRRVGIADLCHI